MESVSIWIWCWSVLWYMSTEYWCLVYIVSFKMIINDYRSTTQRVRNMWDSSTWPTLMTKRVKDTNGWSTQAPLCFCFSAYNFTSQVWKWTKKSIKRERYKMEHAKIDYFITHQDFVNFQYHQLKQWIYRNFMFTTNI